jgi:hypothetical protein
VWLDQGRIEALGPTLDVVTRYLESVANTEPAPVAERPDREGDGSVRVCSLTIEDADGRSVIRSGSRLRVSIGYESEHPVRGLLAYVSVYDTSHTGIFALDSDATRELPDTLPPSGTLTCVTGPIRLTAGRCYVNVGLSKGGAIVDRVEAAAYFDVEPETSYGAGKVPDRTWVMCLLDHTWSAREDR